MLSTTATAVSPLAPVPRFSRFDKKVCTLGKGISGYVELYMDRHKVPYAVKVYHTKETFESKDEFRKRVLHEHAMLSNLCHRNIITVYKYQKSKLGSKVKLYMEAGTEHLSKLLKTTASHSVDELLCIWKQLCQGVQYLHSLNICHRDLKLENLVFDLDFRHLKIIDFATAEEVTLKQGQSIGLVGSEKYAAPETFASLKYDGKATDIWSIGIILYFFLKDEFPWESARHNNQKFKSYSETQSMEMPISQILAINSKQRLSISAIMQDPWFESIHSCGNNTNCGIIHKLTFSIDTINTIERHYRAKRDSGAASTATDTVDTIDTIDTIERSEIVEHQ
ncbi:hypothetical protein KGF56_000731 [Candida oxycetoniae]|uniref:Protein kinase domain-containing protein n=1 Tax=Candida oxycetoniae TaxID=497107 RepID=A0AAI9T1F5_9ASCO|nr:uncharacterized protein KGF56_000731 [Candida oxycetoniae]KAI3406599.2 hypothetical protein KGF56_000731 [Candida oxycetoniae]